MWTESIVTSPNYRPLSIPHDVTLWGFISSEIKRVINHFGDAPWMVNGVSGGIRRFSEIQELVEKAASNLRNRGLKKGDVVCFHSENHVDYVILVLSVIACGAVPFLLPLCSTDALEDQCHLESFQIIFCSASNYEDVCARIKSCPSVKYVISMDPHPSRKIQTSNDLFQGSPDGVVKVTGVESDLAVIFLSSGTTGKPKTIEHTHYSMIAGFCNTAREVKEWEGTEDWRMVIPFHLGHVSGLCHAFMAIRLAHQLIFLPKYDPSHLLAAIQRYKVPHIEVTEKHVLIRVVIDACTAAMSQILVLAVEDGRILVPDEPGELCFKSPSQMKAYRHDEDETWRTIDEQGFIHTGDYGYIDKDGYVFLLARVTDLIKISDSGQISLIPPTKVEDVLLSHVDVMDVAVFGVPSSGDQGLESGDSLVVSVVKKKESDLTKDQLISFLRVPDDGVSKSALGHATSNPSSTSNVVVGEAEGEISSGQPGRQRLDHLIPNILKRERIKLCIISNGVAGKVAEACASIDRQPVVVTFEEEDGFKSLRTLLTEASDIPFPEVDKNSDEDVAMIYFSSGTTGEPKPSTRCLYLLLVVSWDSEEKNESSWIMAASLNFSHIASLLFLFFSLKRGQKYIMFSRYHHDILFPAVEKYKATHLVIFPSTVIHICKKADSKKYDLHSLRTLIVSGAPLSYNMEKVLRARLPNVSDFCQCYGSTEGTWLTFRGNGCYKPGSIGIPYPLVVAKETRETLHEDGYLYTGDYGYMDQDGFCFVRDRIKDLIIREEQGLEIIVAPSEIEGVLYLHPDVMSAAVYGVPAVGINGFVPRASVIKRDESNVQEQELIDFVAGCVSPECVLLGGLEFLSAIPMTPAGKVYRKQLQEAFIAKIKAKLESRES
ncbi:unnamed protein product [Darwinula stevensoni]|uniref:Uncharacterized protein n=1 Tax=Darwinula stevensoni TaxID=69355 RepID=A0A7R8ZXG9_9CRUS|nr:unnamed protein product [Darwinula stevensoni]CAG0878561.1 unnamed protein product [Darwinula stevensoni]